MRWTLLSGEDDDVVWMLFICRESREAGGMRLACVCIWGYLAKKDFQIALGLSF